MEDVAALDLYRPGGQSLHVGISSVVLPGSSVNFPFAHGLWSRHKYISLSVEVGEANLLYLPGGQCLHDGRVQADPTTCVYSPAGQVGFGSHLVCPVSVWYRPTAHFSQRLGVSPPYLPRGQAKHVLRPVCVPPCLPLGHTLGFRV